MDQERVDRVVVAARALIRELEQLDVRDEPLLARELVALAQDLGRVIAYLAMPARR